MKSELEISKRLRIHFPDGVEKKGTAISMTRKFVEEVVAVIAKEYDGDNILLALKRDETETDIRGFVIYIEPITNVVPIVISPYLARIGNDEAWLAQQNAAPELFWLLLPHIEKAITSAQAAA